MKISKQFNTETDIQPEMARPNMATDLSHTTSASTGPKQPGTVNDPKAS